MKLTDCEQLYYSTLAYLCYVNTEMHKQDINEYSIDINRNSLI